MVFELFGCSLMLLDRKATLGDGRLPSSIVGNRRNCRHSSEGSKSEVLITDGIHNKVSYNEPSYQPASIIKLASSHEFQTTGQHKTFSNDTF